MLLPFDTLAPKDGEPLHDLPLAALATFRIYLTTTGSLVINLSVAAVQGLLSVADAIRADSVRFAGGSLLAAPLGHFASAQSLLDRDGVFPIMANGQTPDASNSRSRTDDIMGQWKILLGLHGISPSVLDASPWLRIRILDKKPWKFGYDANSIPSPAPNAFAWPSGLCFQRTILGRSTGPVSQATSIGISGDKYSDPLDEAREWFEGKAVREEVVTIRRRKELEERAVREAVEGDGPDARPSTSSPLALARPGNTGTTNAGAMYPTPPDGVQLAPGITPSLDGVISSPPTQASVAALADGGHGMHSDVQQTNGAYFEGENLYGDLGEDLFANNELTDADFNYFDQVGQEPGSNGLNMSTLSDTNMDEAMDLSTRMGLEQAGPSASYGFQPPTQERPAIPASPVFTKPELKHARSTLGEENRHKHLNAANYQTNVVAGRKRAATGPFDADTVYKRVKASLDGPLERPGMAGQATRRRSSAFERVEFDPLLTVVNKKYQESGQFQINLPSPKDKDDHTADEQSLATLPTTHLYARKAAKPTPFSVQYGEIMAKLTSRMDVNSLDRGQPKQDEDDIMLDVKVDDEDDDLISDDNSEVGTDEPSSPAKSSVARTRMADDDNMSVAGSYKEADHGATAALPAHAVGDLSRLPQPAEPEVSVTQYFADPEPCPLHLSSSDEDYVEIAQILTEQAVSGSLVLNSRSAFDTELQEKRRGVSRAARHAIQCLRSVLPSSLESATQCLFKPFLEIQDVPLLSQPTRMQARPMGQEQLVRPNLFPIAAPHVEVRRNETKLSVLPSAVTFWETLGLSPSEGAKDIQAVCLFPDWSGMADNMSEFVDRVQSMYESLKLGTFEVLKEEWSETSNSLYGGSLPYFADRPDKHTASPPAYMAATPRPGSTWAGYMSHLVQQLSKLTTTEKNIVVYFVYIPADPSTIVEACAAFDDLRTKYERAWLDRKKVAVNQLVLQLVPLDYVASETSLAIPTPADYLKLCLETYDRCTLFGGPAPAPAIVLEQALPNRIDFKMTPNQAPVHVLHENSCMHIGYARSVDGRWITAAWTNNQGTMQMTASYCLGKRERPLVDPLERILREIWDTTHDLASEYQVRWRIVITKCGPMDQAEVDVWVALAHEAKATMVLTLLTVDTNPSLQLIPPAARIPVTVLASFSTTPASTPGPVSNASPEQSGIAAVTPMAGAGTGTGTGLSTAAATPGGAVTTNTEAADAESTLVDVTETTWGSVISHRLNNSTSLTELNPALISGYLIKRSGMKPEDPPVAMEVNVIHSETNNPRAYEALLREMLNYFRGLGTLARVRGMVDRDTDVRPWHVAAAEKGVRALYQLM
jgi:mediator of RNA polymerase II transcription subunit 13